MIKNFSLFKESLLINQLNSDLMESLKIWHDMILSSIGAKSIDIYKELDEQTKIEISTKISELKRTILEKNK